MKIDGLMGWQASYPIFLFMHCAVGLAIRLFIWSQERYLTLGGIITHLKDFEALESKI